MKICQVGVELFRAIGRTDGQTDMTKLIVIIIFLKSSKIHKNLWNLTFVGNLFLLFRMYI